MFLLYAGKAILLSILEQIYFLLLLFLFLLLLFLLFLLLFPYLIKKRMLEKKNEMDTCEKRK